jgi:phosphopantetheine adenylyltransferase
VTSDKRTFVKNDATIFNLLSESVKNAPSKSAGKRTIAKETNNITKEVNKYRLTRGLPPIKTSW